MRQCSLDIIGLSTSKDSTFQNVSDRAKARKALATAMAHKPSQSPSNNLNTSHKNLFIVTHSDLCFVKCMFVELFLCPFMDLMCY